MDAKVYSLDGTEKGKIKLPKVFSTPYNPNLIKRAVLSIMSKRTQPKGADPKAGLKNTARYIGVRGKSTADRTINTNKARLPRLTNRQHLLYGRVAKVSQSVGGRTAHAPKVQKIIHEEINKKEKRLALDSAIAATIIKDLVDKRFIFNNKLPLIIEDSFEDLSKTKEVVESLSKVGVEQDLENAKSKIRKRAGKGKARGRTKKQKKSVLIVSSKNSPVLKASRNLPGVDAVTIKSLNVELLAPGAEAGRLVVWTRQAIEELNAKELKE
jgi:large subunit ribosomal protein L4e